MYTKKCNFCRKTIGFVQTLGKNKQMPVDLSIHDRALQENETGITLEGEVLRGPTLFVVKFRHPHWQHCPKAKEKPSGNND